jgi:hypothetical protein
MEHPARYGDRRLNQAAQDCQLKFANRWIHESVVGPSVIPTHISSTLEVGQWMAPAWSSLTRDGTCSNPSSYLTSSRP